MGDPSFDPAQPDQTGAPGLSPLVKLYMAHRQAGLSDVEAAQKVAAQMRNQADLRGSMRNATDLFRHKQPTGDAYRAQLMGDADQPLKDVQARNAASDEAMKNTLAQGKLQGTDFENQQVAAQMDPNGEESGIARESLKSILPNVAAGLGDKLGRASAYQLYKAVPQLKELAASRGTLAGAGAQEATAGETQAKTAQVGPNAVADRRLKGAEAGKIQAETTQIPATAEAERTAKTAEAGKAQAEAAHTRMLTGGEVVPGYSRGSIPLDEPEAKKINDEYEGNVKAKSAIDEILRITGDKNWVADPKKRAELQPRLSALIGDLRGSVGIQRLAGPEMEFAKSIIANPTAITASNILGLSHNRTRFEALKSNIDNAWRATVHAKDLRQSGGAQGPQGGGGGVKVREKATGKTKTLPAAQAAQVLTDAGYERADAER